MAGWTGATFAVTSAFARLAFAVPVPERLKMKHNACSAAAEKWTLKKLSTSVPTTSAQCGSDAPDAHDERPTGGAMAATAIALCVDVKSFTLEIDVVNPLGAKPPFVTAGRPNSSHADKSHSSPGATNSVLETGVDVGPESIDMIVNCTYRSSNDGESTSDTTTCPYHPRLI